MTYNRVLTTNLLAGLYKNIDAYYGKAFLSDTAYRTFMNGLAKAIFKKAGLQEIDLPLTFVSADKRKTVPTHIIVLHEFNPSFVTERYDAYFAAVLIDDKGEMRLLTYELDYSKDNEIEYACCEISRTGKRTVCSTRKVLNKNAFSTEILKVLGYK